MQQQMDQGYDEGQMQGPTGDIPEGYYVDEEGNPIDPHQYAAYAHGQGDEYEEGEDDLDENGDQMATQSEIDAMNDREGMSLADEKLLEVEKWCHDVIQQVSQTQQLYNDPDFQPDEKSLYIDPMKPPEYSSDVPIVEWKRPQEIWHGEDKPVLMKD